MQRALVFSVLLASTGAARANDVAIDACENVIRNELLAPKTYERVSAASIGRVVTLTYDSSNKYNTPIRKTAECRFSLSHSGWILEVEYSEQKMREAFSGIVQKAQAGVLSREQARQQAAALEQEFAARIVQEATREMRAKAAGPYPIPPHMTSLSQ